MIRLWLTLPALLIFLGGAVLPVLALGVSDFVAVADGPASVVANPAGLADLELSQVSLEHRYTNRELSGFGLDDLMVYGGPGAGGGGALFLAYNEDDQGGLIFDRATTIGYGYGWNSAVSDRLALGLTAKVSYWGVYDDSTGEMTKLASESDLLLDFGMIVKTSSPFQLGLALHNLGRSDQNSTTSFQSAFGVAYRGKHLVLAGELSDFLDEGDTDLDGTIARFGLRYNLFDFLSLHAVLESSDWSYEGQRAGLEINTKKGLMVGAEWFRIDSPTIADETLLFSMGYRF